VPLGTSRAMELREPQRVNTPFGRCYLHQGRLLPSVTTIIHLVTSGDSRALEAWKVRTTCEAAIAALPEIARLSDPDAQLRRLRDEAERALGAAAQRGTRIHAAMEAWLRGEEPSGLEPGDVATFEALRDWVQAHVPGVIATEATIVHPGPPGFAGTADLIGVMDDGATTVVDFKTGSFRNRTAFAMQLAAYASADLMFSDGQAMPMPHVDRAIILQPDAHGKVVAHDLTAALPRAAEVFCELAASVGNLLELAAELRGEAE